MPAEHHAGVLRAATRVNIRKIALDRVVNSGGTILRTLLPARRETGVNSPRRSPDGQHIAALGWPADGKPDENVVYVIPAGGGELRRLTSPEEPGYKEGLEWHPDSRRLTYMYYGHDWRGDETRVAYLDGRATTLLLDQSYPTWDYFGTWSPDGPSYYVISSARRGSCRPSTSPGDP